MVATVSERPAGAPLEAAVERAWSPAWRLAGPLTLLGLALLFVAHWQTSLETLRVWYVSETFNHCFLVFPISGYLIWRRADRLKALAPTPWLPGLVPLALGSLVWLVGNTAGVLVVEQAALIFMGWSLVVTLLGWAVVRALLFPLFFWVFAVPLGTELIPFFQHFTAQLVVPLLRFSGIPVFLENLYLYIPSGSFQVAEACSGVRYLVSTVTLGFLAANILFHSTPRRVVFVLLSAIVPIFANGVRAYGIVMIAHLSDYKFAAGADHLIYGWIFFSIVTFCLLGIGVAMRGSEDLRPDVPAAAPSPLGGLAGQQLSAAPRRAVAVFLVVLLVGSLGLLYRGSMELGIAEASVHDLALTAEDPWSPAAGRARNWRPFFPGASAEISRSYQRPGARVDLYTAYYAFQRQGAEVVNGANRPFGNDKVWRRLSSGQQLARLGDAEVEMWRLVARSARGDRLLWCWYWVDGRFTANRYLAKLYEVTGKLLNRRGEAAVIAVSTRIDGTQEEAAARLQDFLDHVEPIDAALGEIAARAGD